MHNLSVPDGHASPNTRDPAHSRLRLCPLGAEVSGFGSPRSAPRPHRPRPDGPAPRRPRPVRCAAGRRRLEPGASSANGGRGSLARGTRLTGCSEVSAGREKEGRRRPRVAQEVPLGRLRGPAEGAETAG